MRVLYLETLCRHDIPLVRRAATMHFKDFIAVIEGKYVEDFMRTLIQLCKDEQESVRLLCVENCIATGLLISKEDIETSLVPIIIDFARDNSWKVRYVVANNLLDIVKCFFKDKVPQDFVKGPICRILKDSVPEVKISVIPYISSICEYIQLENVINLVLPCVFKMCSENEAVNVRSVISSHITSLCPIIGPENTILHLVEHITILLKDDSSEVRLNLINTLHKMIQVIGIEHLIQLLLSAIIQLMDDNQWRVRKSMIEYLPDIGIHVGITSFNEKLNHIYLSKFTDPVCSIRETAIKNLEAFGKNFGVDWINTNIIPTVLQYFESNRYIYRLSGLQIFKKLSTMKNFIPSETYKNVLLPNILKLVEDKVPNIRLNVALTLSEIIPNVSSNEIEKHIKPALEKLKSDNDKDVRYYAIQVLKLVS